MAIGSLLWLRTLFVSDRIRWERIWKTDRTVELRSRWFTTAPGAFYFSFRWYTVNAPEAVARAQSNTPDENQFTWQRRPTRSFWPLLYFDRRGKYSLGWRWAYRFFVAPDGPDNELVIGVPLWFFIFVGMVIWYVTRPPKPIAAGKCRACGYDLRATPDRCPECGTSVVSKST